MNKDIWLYSGLYLLSVLISVFAQVMLKKSAMKNHGTLVKEYINPLVIAAYAMYVASTLLTMFSYRVVPLSMAPILGSTSYVFVTFFGVRIFKEKMNRKKYFALGLIILGSIVYSVFG